MSRNDDDGEAIASFCARCGAELVPRALRCRGCNARLYRVPESELEISADIDPDTGAAVLGSEFVDSSEE